MAEVIRETLKVMDGTRRYFMSQLDPNYVKNKLKKRKGKCLKCGKCCEDCPFLNKKTKLCKIYKNRPALLCYKNFPLDENDQRLWKVQDVCGYKFEK